MPGIATLDRGHEPDHTRTILLTTLVVTHLLYAFIARQPAAASLRDPLAPAEWFGTPGWSPPSATVSGCSS